MAEKKERKTDLDILMDVDFLASVIVAIGEVANITGVPQRKIRYWDEKGYIEPVDTSSTYRQYNYVNIKKIILIKEMLEEGYTLEVSAKKVSERCERVAEALNRVATKLGQTKDQE